MKRFKGTEVVEPGLYFNIRQLSFKSVDEREALPGTTEETYRRVPVLALLVVGPLLGLAYVIFLPFMGFAMVGWLLSVKAGQAAAVAGRAAVRVLTPGWEPSLAFFSRSKPASKAAPADEWAESVRNRLDGANDDRA
jgi:hypothetical protein